MPGKITQSVRFDKVMFSAISLLASAVVLLRVAMPRQPTHPARAEYVGEDLVCRTWAMDELIEMNTAFVAAMARAGLSDHSTVFKTRNATPAARPSTHRRLAPRHWPAVLEAETARFYWRTGQDKTANTYVIEIAV
jgi:hypothetical protein